MRSLARSPVKTGTAQSDIVSDTVVPTATLVVVLPFVRHLLTRTKPQHDSSNRQETLLRSTQPLTATAHNDVLCRAHTRLALIAVSCPVSFGRTLRAGCHQLRNQLVVMPRRCSLVSARIDRGTLARVPFASVDARPRRQQTPCYSGWRLGA